MRAAILSHLPSGHPWADRIQCFPSLPSTNTYAKQLASQGAPEGTVLIADSQTAGRGRLGRSFHSPAGQGIYLSLILRPHCPPDKLMHLTCAVAVAACDAVERECGFRPGVKWINDLVHEGYKLAGILTELSLNPATGLVDYAVLGIGINCNHRPEDFPPELRTIATSLGQITGSTVCRSQLVAKLLEALLAMNQSLLSGQSKIMAQYRRDCVTLGQEITVIQGDRRRDGTALSLDDSGTLTVRYSDGTIAAVLSGEISIRPQGSPFRGAVSEAD